MNLTHGVIIPLIGGLPIGVSQVLGENPKWVMSMPEFKANDRHYLKYIGAEVISFEENPPAVDIISTTCPCAGLSGMSRTSGEDNPKNEYMYVTAEKALSLKPKVFFGENAPRLYTNSGKGVADKLRAIAEKNNYWFTMTATDAMDHGISQKRPRTFYFFWDKRIFKDAPSISFPEFTPISVGGFSNFKQIEDIIGNHPESDVVKDGKPSENPYFKFLLEKKGMTFKEYVTDMRAKSKKMVNVINEVKDLISYGELADWMDKNGFDKVAEACRYRQGKIDNGLNCMERDTVLIPIKYINALVGFAPLTLSHPYEDRYLTYREVLNIMTMPEDFKIPESATYINHVCQNVAPVIAKAITKEIVKHLTTATKI